MVSLLVRKGCARTFCGQYRCYMECMKDIVQPLVVKPESFILIVPAYWNAQTTGVGGVKGFTKCSDDE